MTTPAWPDHLLTLAEWDGLVPVERRRVELAEGVLQVSPRPSRRHQLVSGQLVAALDAALRPAWRALPEVELTLETSDPPTVRVPDVVVVRTEAVDARSRLGPADVLAVVEVVSPGSRRVDRVLKLAEYAEAGVGHYLVVEPGPPVVLTSFRLADGVLVPAGEHRGRVDLDLGTPVSLDLDAF
ncbi:Uma2 family endonuclease [Actinomycetospora sp. TBRC 11914]|uniref:Uma2 family endonuclease n=1 Tax=Actinomycetospora sp. TBRC 11914 TaxID=2729387 RepID=UPI00145F8258|nr:Uma2 family endonuclease [Actinomycetospora sp. TBRC 11914]NMO91913.1 Uma2 family endonuclease [Actinomycetospora sp. TBRC 11914]